MQIAPEIVYHDVDRSDWVEGCILERMQRLLQTRVSARMQKEVPTVQDPGSVAGGSGTPAPAQTGEVIRFAEQW